MPAPRNPLKAALARGEMQIGLWLAMGSPVAAEIAASSGFDWCLVDAEHAPNDVADIRLQLQAMEGRGAAAVVRVPVGEDWVLKRTLDLGVQNVLVPMVDTAADAARMVGAVRYPPRGRRGVGAAMTRASRFGVEKDYAQTADAEICLMVQIESRRGVENVDAIAATEGVDCVFVGPADLSADMGLMGQLDHPDILAAIGHVVSRTRALGKAAGIVSFNPDTVVRYRDLGVTFLGVGGDVAVLAAALRSLAAGTRAALG